MYGIVLMRKGWHAAKGLPELTIVLGMTAALAGILAAVPTGSSSSTLAFVGHVARAALHGHLNGEFQGQPNSLDLRVLQPGDIVLCHNRNGAYGYWTHAALYVGDDRAVDAYDFVSGTVLNPMSVYRNYDALAVLRVDGPPSVHRLAAQAAMRAIGKAYDAFAPLDDRRSEYCSKLIWQVYRDQGIELCPAKAWVLPDDLAASPRVRWVARTPEPKVAGQ